MSVKRLGNVSGKRAGNASGKRAGNVNVKRAGIGIENVKRQKIGNVKKPGIWNVTKIRDWNGRGDPLQKKRRKLKNGLETVISAGLGNELDRLVLALLINPLPHLPIGMENVTHDLISGRFISR